MATKSLGVLTIDLIAKTGGFEQGMDRAERASEKWRKRVERDLKGVSAGFDDSLSQMTRSAAKMAGAIGVVLSAHQIVEYADTWSELSARVANIVGPGDEADRVMRSISATARSTYSSLNQTAEAFLNNATALTELGYSTEQQLQVSDALNNALVISATRGQQAESVMQALSKSMAAGVLRGDNWNTVLQSGGRIVQALADGLGVTTLELRRMAGDGLLTTQKVVEALTSQVEKLREESAAMAATLGDGAALMGNALLELVGHIDQSTGASAALAESIVAIADAIRPLDEHGNLKEWAENLHMVADAAAVAGVVLGSRLAGGVLASGASFVAATYSAVRYQIALARMAGYSRTAIAGLAGVAVAARTASAAMAVVGGPAGAIILAASSLVYFTTRASEAEREADALNDRIAKLGGNFDKLTAAQAAAAILDYDQKLQSATLSMQAAEARAFTLKRNLEQFPNSKKAEQWAADLIRAEAAVDDARSEVEELNSSLERLNGIVQSGGANALADDAESASEAFQKLNRQLSERLALAGLSTEADRLAARVSGGYIEGLLEGEGDALVAIQKQIDAREAAARAAQQAAEEQKRLQEQARKDEQARLEGIAKEITALERAAATWGMTADEVKIYDLTLQGATDAQVEHARSLLEVVGGFERAKEEQEAYLRVVQDLRTDEERLTDQFHERIAAIDAMAASTRIASDEYALMASRAAEAAFADAPQFAGLAPEVGGPWGELNKVDKAEEELQEWYDKQLAMLEQFRSERADLNAQWDEQEAALHQEHQDKLADIERARQQAQMAAGEEFFGNMAGAAKVFFGENSKLYQAAFAVEKAYAIGKALINVPKSYSDAYAAVVGIPIVGPALAPAAGVAAAAAQVAQAAAIGNINMTGMAHDGIDSIPKTGTWLLEKGERVTTAETSAKLDATLSRVNQNMEGGGSGAPPVVNIIEDPSKAGQRRSYVDDQGRQVLDVWIADFMGEGRTFQAVSRKIGARAVGK